MRLGMSSLVCLKLIFDVAQKTHENPPQQLFLYLLLPLPVWNVKRPMRKAIQKCNNNNNGNSSISIWQEEDATSWTLNFFNFNQVSCCCFFFVFSSIEGRRAAARATVLEPLESVLSQLTDSLLRLFLYKYCLNNSCNYSQHDLRTIGIGLE